MKTSNYILIAFFIFLFGGVFVLFLDAKLDPRGSFHPEFITEEKALDNFSVIIAEPGANIRIKSGETPKVGLNYLKSDTCSFPSFTVRNDTLFVGSNPSKNKYWSTNIICKNITSIEGKDNSQIRIEQLHHDTMLVKLNNAELRYYPGKNSETFSLRVIAASSNIQIGDAIINNLNVTLDQTRMEAWGIRVKNLSGKLNEKSSLRLGEIRKIRLEVDSTSNYRLEKWNYQNRN